jgi:hypothetical protein
MIGIYIVTKNMTREQHTKGRARLRENESSLCQVGRWSRARARLFDR